MGSYTLCAGVAHPRLRVVFDNARGRFAHRAECCDASGESIVLLESIEGSDDQRWPTSPVIQEVHFEDREDGSRVALCVGRAGKSHWSIAAEADADGRQVVFQVACRVRETPETLGSSYRVAKKANAVDWMLNALPPTVMKEQGHDRLLTPGDVASHVPQTISWQYALSIPSK